MNVSGMADSDQETALLRPGELNRRQKIIRTGWIFWAIMLVGFTNAIFGPTVMSLLSVTGTTIASLNLVVVSQGLGFMGGILCGACAAKAMSPSLLLCTSIFMSSFVNTALPWMRSFPALVCFVFIQFFMKGVVDYGAMYHCGQIWPTDNDVPFQFISVGVGLAAFSAPFFAYPVLKFDDRHAMCQPIPGSTRNTSLFSIDPAPCSRPVISSDNIYIPYLVIAAIMLPPGVAFAHYAIADKGTQCRSFSSDYTMISNGNPEKKIYWLVLVLLMLFYMPYGGVYVTYSHLLTAFGVHSHLKMASSSMALMTSLYWGSFLLGRVLNTIFSTYLNQFVLIICNFVGLLVSNVLLVFLADCSEAALWIGSALFSLFNSAFLPGVLTWIGAYISLEGNTIALSLTGVAIGELIIPFLTSFAFNLFGPMSLMWMVFGMVCFELVIFITLAYIAFKKLKKIG